MQRFKLATLALLILLPAPCAARPPADDVISEVPFRLEKGHVIVQAKIRGDKPVEVVLATGTEHSMINNTLLEKYKLQAAYTGDGIITGGNLDRIIYFVPVVDIRVGNVKVTSMNMRFGSASASASAISARVGREIFAVLGADFFRGRVVQFDFGKKVVRFLSQAPPDLLKDGTATDRAVLRMTYKEPVAMPIVENVTFDGIKIKTLFDTGALTVVSFTPSAAKQLGLATPPEKGEPLPGKVGSLRIGGMEFTNLPTTVHAKGSDFDRDSSGFGAAVGIALLQNFVATFDFRDNNLILERR
jgi:hypothetical protein